MVAGIITAAIFYLGPYFVDRLLKRGVQALFKETVTHSPWGQ